MIASAIFGLTSFLDLLKLYQDGYEQCKFTYQNWLNAKAWINFVSACESTDAAILLLCCNILLS